MKHSLRALAFLAALLPSWALAQSAPANMPYHTLYGRLGAAPGDTGPGQAIPFATISQTILTGLCTTNNAIPIYSTASARWICLTTGTGVAAALAVNVGTAGSFVVNGGALGTPSSGTLTNATGLPIGGVTGLGTGVGTALAVNVGSAGAVVVNGGALGTPSSGTLTNATGLPVGGVTGLGAGVATFLATPSSANFAAAVTGETGTGAVVFAADPALSGVPTAPTAAAGTNTTQIATTAGIVAERAATKTLTNTTYNSTAAGNSLQVGGVNLFTGQYPGEPTTGSATAGNVGELISSTVTSGSAVALTTAVVANVTSISLSAGDWDVSATEYIGGGATTTFTFCEASISTTTATQDRTDTRDGAVFYAGGAAVLGSLAQIPITVGPSRFSVSGATTVFLIARCNFATSTANAFGTIRARRMR